MFLGIKLNTASENYDKAIKYLEEGFHKLGQQKTFSKVGFYSHNGLVAYTFDNNILNVAHFGIFAIIVNLIFSIHWAITLVGIIAILLSFFQTSTYLYLKISMKLKKLGYDRKVIKLTEAEFLKNSLNWKWAK